MILGNTVFIVPLFSFRTQLTRSQRKLSTYVHVGKARRCRMAVPLQRGVSTVGALGDAAIDENGRVRDIVFPSTMGMYLLKCLFLKIS